MRVDSCRRASIPLFVYPDASEAALESLYGYIVSELDALYLLASIATIGFLVWLGLSRYGAAKLGEPDELPEFREISWVGMLLWGSLGSWLFYMVMGNYAIFLELSGQLDFTGIMKSANGSAAIVAMLQELPLAAVVVAVFSLISIIFAATTYDSASYTLASSATLHLKAGDDPARWHRVFWAFALGLMPVALMLLQGSLRPIQVILLIVSLPILFVGVAMSGSLVRTLRTDFAA